MKLKSFLRKFFLGGEVLEKVYSPINGEILVTEDLFGKKEMVVGKVDQSGGLVEGLWEQIFNFQFSRSNFQCLILGLGAGTVARLMSTKFPDAKMVGIEIDPKVVEIGKKYFDLDKIPNLKIIIADAIKIIDDSRPACRQAGFTIRDSRFDLIIVDLYIGQEYPKEAESDRFLEGLKKILAKNGLIIFNRLNFNRNHRLSAAQFRQKLTGHFPCLKSEEIAYNLLIFASLEPQKKV